MTYAARWNATDQIPTRAVREQLLSRFGDVDPSDGGSTSRTSLDAEWQRSAPNALTQASAYAIRYRLNLFSNFTYFLDDPLHGDQFEQADDRIVTGLRASHRWQSRWREASFENVTGLQARRDDIRSVGLFHTQRRERLGTIRHDALTLTAGALFAQNTIEWLPHLRLTAGLRADAYDRASLASPKLALVLGPWRNTELYADAGSGFHSNDARGDGTPLVRTRGGEIGLRSTLVPRVHVTASLRALNMDSELVFAGDAGTTEASDPSRRTGVELEGTFNLQSWLAIDSGYAYSRARFRNGDRIPGAIEGVASSARAPRT
jgi:outer membrane receptor protein involved in Fe transport